MHYVIGMPEMTAFIFIPYLASQLLSIFLWTALARRIGKRRTWLSGMAVAAPITSTSGSGAEMDRPDAPEKRP